MGARSNLSISAVRSGWARGRLYQGFQTRPCHGDGSLLPHGFPRIFTHARISRRIVFGHGVALPVSLNERSKIDPLP
jgi:hypothetical protein